MSKGLSEAQVMKGVKAGKIITVRAKNGHGIPMFHWKPDAYRCVMGKQRIAGTVVYRLLNRRLIEPVKRGWYSEGQFRLNKNLRDERGQFRRAALASPVKGAPASTPVRSS